MADFSEWQADVFDDFLAGAGDTAANGGDGFSNYFLDDELPDSMSIGNLLGGGGGANKNGVSNNAESLFRNPPQIIQRNATLFLIDCSASMFAVSPLLPAPSSTTTHAAPPPPQPPGTTPATTAPIEKPFHHCQTPFSRAVTFARKFYEHSVLTNASASSGAASSKDLMAIVLYNTRERLNQYSFPGVFVFQEFDSPSAPRVQELDTLAKTGVFVVSNPNAATVNTAQQNQHSAGAATTSSTAAAVASSSHHASLYAQKYEEFQTHIGHNDVATLNSDGSVKQESTTATNHHNHRSGAGSSSSSSCKLSDALWNAQHMFHFLKSATHSSGVATAAANAGKSILYRFQKNVLIFTDKEDPIRTYASALANKTLQDQLLASSSFMNGANVQGGGAGSGVAQRLQALLQMDPKSKMVYLKKVSELMSVERIKCESRVRDLIEEGATMEVLGYTTTAATPQLPATTTTAAKLPSFDPRRCWGPLLRSPYTSASAANHQENGGPQRNSLNNSGGGGGVGGSYPNAAVDGGHSSSTLGGAMAPPDSHNVNYNSAVAVVPTSSSAVPSSEKVVLDWFATLGGDNAFASSSTPSSGVGGSHSGPGSVSSQSLRHAGGKRARSPGGSSDGGGSSSHAASSSIVPSSYTNSARQQQQRGNNNNNTAAVAVEVYDDDRCSARVLVFDRSIYKGMPKSATAAAQQYHGDDDDDDDMVEDEASHFFDTLSITRTFPRRPVGSLTMSFGPLSGAVALNSNNSQHSTTSKSTLAVQLYLPVVKCLKPRFCWRHATTNDAVVTKMKRIGKGTGEEMPTTGKLVEVVGQQHPQPNLPYAVAAGGGGGGDKIVKRVLYAGTVGGRRILFSEMEKQVIRSGTFMHPKTMAMSSSSPSTNTTANKSTSSAISGASVRILCTKPYEVAIRAKYSVGRCGFLHPQSLPAKLAASVTSGVASSKSLIEAEANNVKLFVGLHRVLLEKGLVAIAELSSVRRAPSTTSGVAATASSSASTNGIGLAETLYSSVAAGGGGGAGSSSTTLPNEAYQSAPRLVALVPAKLPTDQLDGIVPHAIYSLGTTGGANTTSPIIPAGFYQSIQSAGGCGFHVIPLPYADDIRSLTAITKQFQQEDPRQSNPVKHSQLVAAAEAIIRKLSAPYAPSDLPNPALAHTYGMLQRLALMQDDDDDEGDNGQYVGHYAQNNADTDDDENAPIFPGVDQAKLSKIPKEIQRSRALKKKRLDRQNMSDLTLPDRDGMARYQQLFSTFSSLAFSPQYDPDYIVPPPAGSAAGSAAPLSTSEKAAMATNDIKSMDFDNLEQNGTLSKLTIPILAAYLKAAGAPSSGRKQDLVDAVTKLIIKKRQAGGGGVVMSQQNQGNGVKAEPSH